MHIIQGDLIKLASAGYFDVIVHGCNCFCSMGAGIAKTIKSVFPEAYQADITTCEGSKAKLGTYSHARVTVGGQELIIINAYTQFHWRGNDVLADYDAITRVFQQIKKDHAGKRIGYPKIGAGLAGGDWHVIAQIIDNELQNEQHTLVEYTP